MRKVWPYLVEPVCRASIVLVMRLTMSCGTCSEKTKANVAAATGAPQATDVVQQFRTRWRRWLGNKTRRDMPTWVTLLDSNWMGWVERVSPDYISLRLEDAGRENVKALWLAAIDAASMDDLYRLDELYAAEKAGL